MIGTPEQLSKYLWQLDKDKKYELTAYIEKRSNKANRYMWELLGKLCFEMNLNPVKEYKKRVRELGIFRHWDIEKENVETFKKMWTDKGIAWFVDIVDIESNGRIPVNAYYGSSSYNSKQMSKLIDGVVQDCQAIGIETKTPEEIASLLKEINYTNGAKNE